MFPKPKQQRAVSIGTKIERAMVTVWRVRIFIAYVLLMLLITYLFPVSSRLWGLIALILSFVFLAMYLIYYPIKYNKLSYDVRNNLLIVNCGVIYTRIKAIPIENIQFITVTASWTMQYFNLHTLIVHGAGGSIHIPGIKVEDAEVLRRKLEK